MSTVDQLWRQIQIWIAKNTDFDPGFEKGYSQSEIKELEAYLGRKLPDDFFKSLRSCSRASGVIPSPQGFLAHSLMSIDESIEAWEMMNRQYDMGTMDHARVKVSKGVVRQWWAPYWIPFAQDGSGDFFCIDLCPTYPGRIGQILWVPHDLARRPRQASSFKDFLHQLASHYTEGKYVYEPGSNICLGSKSTFPNTSMRN